MAAKTLEALIRERDRLDAKRKSLTAEYRGDKDAPRGGKEGRQGANHASV